MRQLTNEEIKICEIQLKNLESETDYQNYLKEYTELLINKGLKLNYDKALREKKQQLREIETSLEELKFTKDTLIKQMKEGVEEHGKD